MKKLTAHEVFLKKANSDLKAAFTLINDPEIESDIICFHFQQFVEKYFKAFLIYNNFIPKKIHDLTLLLEHCTLINPEFKKFENSLLLEISDCGVMIRYDEIDEVDRDFINKVIPEVLDFKAFIEDKLFLK